MHVAHKDEVLWLNLFEIINTKIVIAVELKAQQGKAHDDGPVGLNIQGVSKRALQW
jgi:hypothetical protein